jgi:hypothetical protein
MSSDPSIGESGILDLLHTKWTSDDYFQCDLTVKQIDLSSPEKKYEVHYQKSQAQFIPYWKLWLKCVTKRLKWLMAKDASLSSVYSVAKAFEAIAAKELADQNASDLASLPLDERVEKIQDFQDRLENLRFNLINYNEVIKKFNQSCLLKNGLFACPLHAGILNHLNLQKLKLVEMQGHLRMQNRFAKMQQHLQTIFNSGLDLSQIRDTQKIVLSDLERKVLDLIQKIHANICDGQKIDGYYINESYPAFLRALEQLHPSRRQKYLTQYQGIVNLAYVKNLLNGLNTHTLPLPQSIHILLKFLGFSEEWIQEKIPLGAQSLSEKLMIQLSDKAQLAQTPSSKLVTEVQSNLFSITSGFTNLASNHLQRFQLLLQKLYSFELDWETNQREALLRAKEFILKSFGKLFLNENKKQHMEAVVASFYYSSQFGHVLNELLLQLNLSKSVFHFSTDQFAQFLKQLDVLIEKQKNYQILGSETMPSTYDLILKEFNRMLERGQHEWFEANQEALQFINPLEVEGVHILGQGARLAINYRWIKGIMRNPEAQFRSVEDLEKAGLSKNLSEADEKADTIFHSQYQVGASKKRTGSEIGEHILSRDGLSKQASIQPQKTITELINQIIQGQSLDSSGVIDITAYEAFEENGQIIACSNGHAIGLQISPHYNIYRFWDVNSGLYCYSNLEKLTQELEAYMNHFYFGKYNHFIATQYISHKVE